MENMNIHNIKEITASSHPQHYKYEGLPWPLSGRVLSIKALANFWAKGFEVLAISASSLSLQTLQ
jgi:hypothetical protein